MIRLRRCSFGALLLSSCVTAPDVPAARSELAPTGKLRVGIKRPEFPARQQGACRREYSGIAVDLGRELGGRLASPSSSFPSTPPESWPMR